MTPNFEHGGPDMSSLFAASDSGSGGAALVVLLVLFAVAIVVIIGWWKMFEKAGEPGWKAIIPIYNLVVLLKIVGRPVWWILLLLIPCVGFVVSVIVMIDLARSFGKGTGFGIGLFLLPPVFAVMLGFGDDRYLGPAGPEGGAPLPPPAP